jgi:hypothetical protein
VAVDPTIIVVVNGAVAGMFVVPVTLVWQALTYTNQDLKTGVQLVSPAGDVVVSERWGRPNRIRRTRRR